MLPAGVELTFVAALSLVLDLLVPLRRARGAAPCGRRDAQILDRARDAVRVGEGTTSCRRLLALPGFVATLREAGTQCGQVRRVLLLWPFQQKCLKIYFRLTSRIRPQRVQEALCDAASAQNVLVGPGADHLCDAGDAFFRC